MKKLTAALPLALSLWGLGAFSQAADHREVPVLRLDQTANSSGVHVFRSFDSGSPSVMLILGLSAVPEAENGVIRIPSDPDSPMSYEAEQAQTITALVTGAQVEFGQYVGTETQAQGRPATPPGAAGGLTRAAYLRTMFGDAAGVASLMQQVLQDLPATETPDRAWLLIQLAQLALLQGRTQPAAALADQALMEFADYHHALSQLSGIGLAQEQPQAAVELRHSPVEVAPLAENFYRLALVLREVEMTGEAAATCGHFEAAAVAAGPDPRNDANHELIAYHGDIGYPPPQAEEEYAQCPNTHTLGSYAWALHQAGRSEEAWSVIRQVVTVGVQDPDLLRHAEIIAIAVGNANNARQPRNESMMLTPQEDPALLRDVASTNR